MSTTNQGRARKRPLPRPASPASRGKLANTILRAVIETADHIATAPRSGIYPLTRSHFLLVELSEQAFRQLCQHKAEQEDDEPDHDNERDVDDEPEDYHR